MQAACLHKNILCTWGKMINGRPIIRFRCVFCDESFTSLQMIVSDHDRKISSVKYADKTLEQIAEMDMPYLQWVATQSKMSTADRYAAARIVLQEPYWIPQDGEIITNEDRYDFAVARAIDFIRKNTPAL